MKQTSIRQKRKRPPQEVTDTGIRKGILALTVLFGIVAFVILAGRLVKLMLVDHEYYQSKAISNQTRSTSVTASRGTVYDRNMEVLAASTSVENIFLDPLELKQNHVDIDFLAENLAVLLDLDEDYIKKQASDTAMRYKLLRRKQGKEVCDAVRQFVSDNDIVGVHLEPDSLRYYPNGETASQLLGFTNTENKGSEGLEAYYNSILEGTAGAVITTKGNNETEMLYSYETYYEATDGDSLVLTIDLTVQKALEKQMRDAIDRYDVQNGAFGIVMDAQTGDILAMATLGGYDPNSYLTIYDDDVEMELEAQYQAAMEYPEDSEEREQALSAYNSAVAAARLKQWRNRCVSDGYEPGSTFKLFTLAAGLDSGAVTLSDTFYCAGAEKLEGRQQPLNCWRHSGHGSETTAQALQNSCNIAFAHMGLKIGGGTLYDYCRAFGLMEQTGIDLPGEASGLFHSRERLSDNDTYGTSYLIATSFGQTVKPTPIQMVTAVSAVVNGGYLLEPHVVSQVLDEKGNVLESYGRTVVRQVISEETSATMCELIESVVTEGTAKNAKVAGFRIGGKTGTAEKTDTREDNGQLTNDKIVSFVGIAPMNDPRYVVLVALDTPNPASGIYISGGVMAAPTVAAVFEDILPYLGVEAEYEEGDMSRINVRMPDVSGMSESKAAAVLQESGLSYRILGSGSSIVSQLPKAGRELPAGSTVLLYTDNSMPTDPVTVPNLMGMNVTDATKALTDCGLYLQAKGTDSTAWHVVVTGQDIAAGTQVERGTTVTVLFADTSDMD
ncbi:MAG: penicillin-binding transpeptidase domain-containing protein [Faecousia sp.]